jgi:hypothetical protein
MSTAALLAGALTALAAWGVHATAQGAAPAPRTQARFIGGFYPDACRYPAEERRTRVSACCIMDLDIDAAGHLLASDGTCTHPAFLAPTQRCLAAHAFAPATVNGRPVRAKQSMEYEWRAEGPAPASLCKPLRTS